MKIDGAVVVLTGASRGIGRSTAVGLARKGAIPVLVARQSNALVETLAEVRDLSPQGLAIPTDITKRDAVVSMIGKTVGRFGRVDVLINNAGRGAFGPFLEVAPDRLEQAMQLNFWGAIFCIHAVLPQMLAQRSGLILNVGAIDGKFGLAGDTVGVSTKFALVGLSEALHLELKPHGVKVALVNPGAVDTEAFQADFAAAPGMTRWTAASPERVARAIIRAVETEPAEVMVPSYLNLAVYLRHFAPALFRWLAARVIPPPSGSSGDKSGGSA
jgi:hypothetical protein